MSRPIQLLVVDQDADTRFTVIRTLTESMLDVVGEVPFGTEAVQRAVATRPDVILCALEDPMVRPIETIEALRHALPETPIIAYSSRSDIAITRRALLAGVRDFLVRPLEREDIESAVFNLFASEEQRLQRLSGRGALSFEGTVVAVYSAKGGVGKTTFSSTLAGTLAYELGQSVALLDLDTSFGDAAVAMGLPASDVGIVSLIEEMRSRGEADIRSHLVTHESGARVLPAPVNALEWNAITADEVATVIDYARRIHDYVVIDLSATPNPITITALARASMAFWLLTPDVYTMHDSIVAKRLLASVSPEAEGRTRYILNHLQDRDELSRAAVEGALGTEVYWDIPYDPRLHQLTQRGEAKELREHPGRGAASIVALARALAGVSGTTKARPHTALGGLRALVQAR